MRIALDTNLIAWETPRRLLHGISKETDLSVTVLPQVHEEAAKWLVENEKDLWVERVGEDDAYTGTQREQIVERASEAVREWFEEELKRTETPWSLQGETFEQGVNAPPYRAKPTSRRCAEGANRSDGRPIGGRPSSSARSNTARDKRPEIDPPRKRERLVQEHTASEPRRGADPRRMPQGPFER